MLRKAMKSISPILITATILSIFLFSSPSQAKIAESASAVKCLADAIYFESRGEPRKGQELVAKVVLNRTKSKKFPNTVCGVVKQPSQFSWVRKNPKVTSKASYESAKTIARHMIRNHHATEKGALFFYNPKKSNPSWARKMKVVERVGNHVALRP